MKETTKRISSQEQGFLNFLRPLGKTNLSLMKSVLIPLAKEVLVPLGLMAAALSTDAAIIIQKETFWIGYDCTDNLE